MNWMLEFSGQKKVGILGNNLPVNNFYAAACFDFHREIGIVFLWVLSFLYLLMMSI
jgi:hypothetical protein